MKLTKPSGNYSVRPEDEGILYTAGTYDIILPKATGSGRELWIFNFGTGEITVKADVLETIHYDTDLTMTENDVMHLIDLTLQKWVVI